MDEPIEIASPQLTVGISPRGAEMRRLRTSVGHDLLWSGDARWWGAISPLLFPVIGRLPEAGPLIGGRRYPLPMHGFAQTSLFTQIARAADRATFLLVDDDASRAVYPFAFALTVDYAVQAETLTMTVTVANTGTAAMPASAGFHPGFRWPVAGLGAKEDHRVRFAETEDASIWRASAGFRLPDKVPSPLRGRDLPLTEAEFATGAVIFGGLHSRSVEFMQGERTMLTVGFDGCPNLALWSRPGGDFLCIEPWNGLPQTAAFDGEVAERPGMIVLEPERSMVLSIRVAVAATLCL